MRKGVEERVWVLIAFVVLCFVSAFFPWAVPPLSRVSGSVPRP